MSIRYIDRMKVAHCREVYIDFSPIRAETYNLRGNYFGKKKQRYEWMQHRQISRIASPSSPSVYPTFATGKKRMMPRVTIWLPEYNEIVPQCYSKTRRLMTIELTSCTRDRIPWNMNARMGTANRFVQVPKSVSSEILSRKFGRAEKNRIYTEKRFYISIFFNLI